jgi:hypothetical protein
MNIRIVANVWVSSRNNISGIQQETDGETWFWVKENHCRADDVSDLYPNVVRSRRNWLLI